jgi:diguanylate cyclase (GGDEF)-like protein
MVNCTTIRGEEGSSPTAFAFLSDISKNKLLEDKAHRAYTFRIAISALLETGLETLSLVRQLHVAMEIVLTIPNLSIGPRGAFFIWNEKVKALTLVAQTGLPDTIAVGCAQVSAGECLCGRTAVSGQLTLEKQDTSFPTIEGGCLADFSHYCLPILSRKKLLGVILLALPDGHSRNQEEEALLTTIGVTIAGLIAHRRMEEKIRQIAHSDSLTGLPNRLAFQNRLEQELAHARRERSSLAVLFMDLDGFKQVNDRLGHEAGDLVLVEATKRIQHCLREVDTAARIGGDEFTVILHGVSNQQDAGLVAEKIIHCISDPFQVLGSHCQIGVSIGIALYPDHGKDPESLIQKSDLAMYAAKGMGRGVFCTYQPPEDDNDG